MSIRLLRRVASTIAPLMAMAGCAEAPLGQPLPRPQPIPTSASYTQAPTGMTFPETIGSFHRSGMLQ